MKRRTDDRDDRLRRLLRAGDPASDGAEPSAAQVAGWKARMLEAAGAAPVARPVTWRWAIPAAGILAAGILIGISAGRHLAPQAPRTSGAAATGAGDAP